MSKEIERRFIPAEIRVEGGNGEKRIVGYSARFNAESEDLGGFTEFIAPGAFTNALKNADTRFLFNHMNTGRGTPFRTCIMYARWALSSPTLRGGFTKAHTRLLANMNRTRTITPACHCLLLMVFFSV